MSQFGYSELLSALVNFLNHVAAVNEEPLNCNEKNLNFTNLSSGASSYFWDFGIPNYTSAAANPSYTYPAYGNYTITLIAQNGACADTLRETIHVFPTLSLSPLTTKEPQCLKSNFYTF